MQVLSELEPNNVFYYFEEICKIPHGSYHEKEISDYLVAFAREHGIEVYQDNLYNVIMKINASEGYEKEEPVILQGHMDMVCEKNPAATIDMEKEGLELVVENGYVYAKDTTLGGDDGIALAYMLAIASDTTIAHPPLEFIFTVSEEVGMEGAAGIDLSMLKGERMLNLDSEDEGIFLSSCAGGLSLHSSMPIGRKTSICTNWYEVTVSGLQGGHSGCEIDKGRANANRILGRVLFCMKEKMFYELKHLEGGRKDNAIPISATAIIGIREQEKAAFMQEIVHLNEILKAEYAYTDAGINISVKEQEDGSEGRVLEDNVLREVLLLLLTLPEGVQNMSMEVKGLVETSLNLGIMRLEEDKLFLQHSIRSSVTSKKKYVAMQVEGLLHLVGGMSEVKGEYPAWEYKADSVVRARVVELYKKMYKKEPVVEGIHAGLECGLLADKIKNLDCVAMGPDILDIHTTKERLDIASVKRVYEFIVEYLKIKDGK